MFRWKKKIIRIANTLTNIILLNYWQNTISEGGIRISLFYYMFYAEGGAGTISRRFDASRSNTLVGMIRCHPQISDGVSLASCLPVRVRCMYWRTLLSLPMLANMEGLRAVFLLLAILGCCSRCTSNREEYATKEEYEELKVTITQSVPFVGNYMQYFIWSLWLSGRCGAGVATEVLVKERDCFKKDTISFDDLLSIFPL